MGSFRGGGLLILGAGQSEMRWVTEPDVLLLNFAGWLFFVISPDTLVGLLAYF